MVDEVRKAINAHGVFVIEIQKGIDGKLGPSTLALTDASQALRR
jgi:hypothetical protein